MSLYKLAESSVEDELLLNVMVFGLSSGSSSGC
jgi:hypothetical protein